MKTINLCKTVFTFILVISLFSCSKDENNTQKISERKEYSFTTVTTIPNNGVDNLELTINVPESRIIIDPSKVKLEVKLQHERANSLHFLYKNPSGNYKSIFVFTGGVNSFVSQNSLLFGSTHTKDAFDIVSLRTIAAGNYNSILSDVNPVERPLFSQTSNKNIQGNWNFFISDVTADSWQGNLYSIKLIFEEGALNIQ